HGLRPHVGLQGRPALPRHQGRWLGGWPVEGHAALCRRTRGRRYPRHPRLHPEPVPQMSNAALSEAGLGRRQWLARCFWAAVSLVTAGLAAPLIGYFVGPLL